MGQLIDIIIIAITLFFAIRGLFMGFVSEILSLLAYVAGYFVALIFSPYFIGLILGKTNFNALFVQIAVYVVLFIATYIVVKIIEVQIVRVTNTSILSGLNRVMGVLLGLVQGILIVIIIDFLLDVQPLFDFTELLAESRILAYIRTSFGTVHGFFVDLLT